MKRKVTVCVCLGLGFLDACSHPGSTGNAGHAGAGSDVASGITSSDGGQSPTAAPEGGAGGQFDSTVGMRYDGGATQPEAGAAPTSHCKRGVAYGDHSKADLNALQPAVAWWYNWAYQPDAALRDGSYRTLDVEYVPMIWGGSFDASSITATISPDVKALLGFNEPNFGSQANLSAAQAAARWPDVEKVADAHQLALVSPAVNYCGGNCQDTNPFHYLDDFFAACRGCRVDKVAFHIYVGCHPSGANKAQWLIDQVETYKQRFSQPLWLTEFACTDAANFDEQIAFMRDAVAYLEQDARVERYAWFSGRFHGIPYVDLLANDGQLTPLGTAYVSAPTNADCQR